MKITGVSYLKINPSFIHKFYELNTVLFPDLKISKPNKKGIISIREKGFFLRRRIKKHILSFLLNDLTAALTFKRFGSTNMIRFYRQKMEKELTYNTGEISNVSRIIYLLHAECFNTVALEVKESINKPELKIIHKIIEIEEEKGVIESKEPEKVLNLLDFIIPRIESRLQKVRVIVTAATIAALLFTKNPFNWDLVDTGVGILYNVSSREPPFTELFLYNST